MDSKSLSVTPLNAETTMIDGTRKFLASATNDLHSETEVPPNL